MTHKTILFLTLKSEKTEDDVSLKRVLYLKPMPVKGLKIKIHKRVHRIIDVTYDFNDDEYIVELEDDISITKNVFNVNIETFSTFYIEEGWERLEPFHKDREEILNIDMNSAISLINKAKDALSIEIFIDKSADILLKSGIKNERDIRTILFNANVDLINSTLIVKKIEERLKIKF